MIRGRSFLRFGKCFQNSSPSRPENVSLTVETDRSPPRYTMYYSLFTYSSCDEKVQMSIKLALQLSLVINSIGNFVSSMNLAAARVPSRVPKALIVVNITSGEFSFRVIRNSYTAAYEPTCLPHSYKKEKKNIYVRVDYLHKSELTRVFFFFRLV